MTGKIKEKMKSVRYVEGTSKKTLKTPERKGRRDRTHEVGWVCVTRSRVTLTPKRFRLKKESSGAYGREQNFRSVGH